MKSRRRSGALLGLAIAVVALVVTGWIVLTGRVDWLARFAEPRIGGVLREAGFETDSVNLAQLSLEGGRVEHARMRFKGGTVEIHGLEVSIGLGNAISSRVGSVTIDRLIVELNGGPLGINASQPTAGNSDLPFGTIIVKEWSISSPLHGTAIRATGDLHATPEAGGVVKFSGKFSSDEAKGGYSGELATATGRALVRIDDAEIAPAAVLTILRGLPDSAAAGITIGWNRAVLNGEITLESGNPVRANAHVRVAGPVAVREEEQVSLDELTADVTLSAGSAPSIDAEGLRLRANSGAWNAAAESMQFVGGLSGGNFALGRLALSSGERSIRGHSIGSFALGEGHSLKSAEGTLVVGAANIDGLAVGESEIELRWSESVLSARTPRLPVSGVFEAVFEDADVSVSDLGAAQPSAGGSAVVVLDTSTLLGSDTVVSPSRERIPIRFITFLAPGAESLRVEFDAPVAARTVQTPGFTGIATGSVSGVVTLDANNVTGSFNGDWSDVSLDLKDGRRALFSDLKFKWATGRVWIDSVRNWPAKNASRTLRELLWISNVDVRGTGGTIQLGEDGLASGVSATILSNGADLSERAGGSLAVSAKTIRSGEDELADLSASLAFGLGGGTLVADLSLASPRIPLQLKQSVGWTDGISSAGTFSTDRVDLATIDVARIIPGATGMSAHGFLTAAGNTRLGTDGLVGDAVVSLDGVQLDWSARKASIGGISGKVALESLSPLRARPGQRIRFSNAALSELTLSDGILEFGMPSQESIEVSRLDARLLGGRVSASPFAFNPADPRPSTHLRLEGVRLEELLAFFPDIPARAEGPIVGDIPVSWDGGQVAFGSGHIDLQPGELGRVRFNYDIRVLTANADRGEMLFDVKRQIETSIRDLHFNRLRIDLYPRDVPGRSAQIRLVGVTASERILAPVQLDVNIDAPLERFIKFGDNPVKP